MRKFYFSVEQRESIIDALLKRASSIELQIKQKELSESVLDLACAYSRVTFDRVSFKS